MIDRRRFIFATAGTLIGNTLASAATQEQLVRTYRIGFLGIPSAAQFESRVSAFRAGLRDRGYVEGKNLLIEFRWAGGDESRLPELAAELVGLNVDVIVTHATAGALAAKRATTIIPIVMAVGGDAIAAGLAESLSRPGGNLTGSNILIPELNAKRLELLKEVLPRARRVALLVHQGSPANEPMLRLVGKRAESLDLAVRTFAAARPAELGSVFSEMATAKIDAVVVFEEPMFVSNATEVADLATKRQMPLVGFVEIAGAGALIGYGADILEMYRHSAVFVDKILKGTKPADIPIEQATRFQLIINLRTARALGLTIPQSLLLRADEVIE